MPAAEPNPILPSEDLRARSRGPASSSFVPGLVHELRNFSFGISGSLDALQARFGQMEDLGKYHAVMRASLDRLNGFLDELGDYGDPKAQPWVEQRLEPLLREALDRNRAAAEEAGVAFRLELEEPLPLIRADAPGLCTAFARLVGLAIGRQPFGGRVSVCARAGIQEDQPVIAGYLASSGLELPGVDLSRLFEPFYYRASGFGRLALPVARRVLETHGGSLGAAPEPGGGVRMSFTLPALQL